MPFATKFKPIYDIIQDAMVAPELNFICKKANDIRGGGHILQDVFREIAQSEIIIADLSGSNPNVFYELGIVQMVKDVKKVILLIEDIDTVPFDVTNFRFITYERSKEGARRLRKELISAVKEVAGDALRFELRGRPGRYKLPHRELGPDHLAYDFEITDCAYIQKGVKIDLRVTRHVLGKKAKVIKHISRGLSEGQRIELPGLKRELELEQGTKDFARFVVHPAAPGARKKQNQQVIYETSRKIAENDLAGHNSYIYIDNKIASERSEGELHILANGICHLERRNAEGRFAIELRHKGAEQPSLAKTCTTPKRALRVSCEAKVDSGEHHLRFVWKDIENNKWVVEKLVTVGKATWNKLEFNADVPACVDLLFRIDDLAPSQVPSGLYLRKLAIMEA